MLAIARPRERLLRCTSPFMAHQSHLLFICFVVMNGRRAVARKSMTLALPEMVGASPPLSASIALVG
jgi:hypothetical protein